MSLAEDLAALAHRIGVTPTVPDSIDTLLWGLRDLLEKEAPEFAAALREFEEQGKAAKLRGEDDTSFTAAVTRGTSTVYVDPRHPGYAAAHRLLTEEPELDRAKEIEDLRETLQRGDAASAQLLAEHEKALATVAAQTTQIEELTSTLAAATGELEALAKSHNEVAVEKGRTDALLLETAAAVQDALEVARAATAAKEAAEAEIEKLRSGKGEREAVTIGAADVAVLAGTVRGDGGGDLKS